MEFLTDDQLKKLKFYNTAITKSHADATAYYVRGSKYEVFADAEHEFYKKMKIYELALLDYTEAINLTEVKKSARVCVYRIIRSKLYLKMEDRKKAANDLLKISKEDVDRLEGLEKYFFNDIMEDIVKQQKIQETIHTLNADETISPAIIKLFKDVANTIANHSVQITILDATLKQHSKGIVFFEDQQIFANKRLHLTEDTRQTILKQLVANSENVALKEAVELLAHRHEELVEKVTKLNEDLREQDDKKVDRSELEPTAFKVDESISSDKKLQDYYNAFYDILYTRMLEAVVINGYHVEIDAAKIKMMVLVAAADAAAPTNYFVGRVINELITIKKKAANIVFAANNPSDRENLIKMLAEGCTLKRQEKIKNVSNKDEEIQNWSHEGWFDAIKKLFVFDATEQLYSKNAQTRLGCIDALKIVWVFKKRLISDQAQLIDVPINYRFLVVTNNDSEKFINRFKIVPVDQTLPEDEIIFDDGEIFEGVPKGLKVTLESVENITYTEEKPSQKSDDKNAQNYDLSSKLKYLYSCQKEIPKLIEIDDERLKLLWDKHYINLKLLIKTFPKGLGNSKMEDYNEIELENIFESGNSSEIKKVLFLGLAGAGKSTLLYYICYKWGREKLWSHKFDFVFRIHLKHLLNSDWKKNYDIDRELRVNKLACFTHYNLIIQYLNLKKNEINIPESEKIIMKDILEPKDKVLLLVDGYDEVSHLADRHDAIDFQEIMKDISQHRYIIMSSRPNALKLNKMEKFNQIVESKGLDTHNITNYINLVYGEDSELSESLISFLEHNCQVRAICQLPIYMVLLCLIWSDEHIRGVFVTNLDININLLYHEVILWLEKRYLVNFENEGAERILPTDIFEHRIIQFLHSVAFQSFVEGGNFINNQLTKKHLGQLNIANIYKFGILKASDVRIDIVNLDIQFIQPTFQEFLTALHLINRFASNDEDDIRYFCNFISQHRNEPKYLMVLKFLAGMVSSQKEGKSENILVMRTWESFTCSVDGILEFDLEGKVALLMHLLEQSKVNGNYDERIPNLGKIIEFIDSAILADVTKYKSQIIESGYISNAIKENLEVVFDDIAREDELKVRIAIEIFTSLAHKCGGRSNVLQKTIKVLHIENWRLQKLSLEKLKMINSSVSEEFLRDILLITIPLLRNAKLMKSAINLLLRIVSVSPNLIHYVIEYINHQLSNKHFNDKYVAESVSHLFCEMLIQMSIEGSSKLTNSMFQTLKTLFLKIDHVCNNCNADNTIKFFRHTIQYAPKDLFSEVIKEVFQFFENIMLYPTWKWRDHCQREALSSLVDLTILVPDNEKPKMGSNILILFGKILKLSGLPDLIAEVMTCLPKLINILPKDKIPGMAVSVLDLFKSAVVRTKELCIKEVKAADSLSILIEQMPDMHKLDMFCKILIIIEEIMKNRTMATNSECDNTVKCIVQLVSTFLENDLNAHDRTFELYDILARIIQDKNRGESFREVVVHGLLQLVKSTPQIQKEILIDLTFELLTDIATNQDVTYLKRRILMTLPQFIATTSKPHLLDKIKQTLIFLDAIQVSSSDALHVKIPALGSVLTLSINPELFELENLLNRIRQTLKMLETIIQVAVIGSQETCKAIINLLDIIMISCLTHLPDKQKDEATGKIFKFLENIMKDPKIELYQKWNAFNCVKKLVEHRSEDVALCMSNASYKLLEAAILKSTDLHTICAVLHALIINVNIEMVELVIIDTLRKCNAVLKDFKTDTGKRFVIIDDILLWCEHLYKLPMSSLTAQTAFNELCTLIKFSGAHISYCQILRCLTKLIKVLPNEHVNKIADDTIKWFISLIRNAKETMHDIEVVKGIANVILKSESAYQEMLLNKIFEQFNKILTGHANYHAKMLVINALPTFIVKVRIQGCENKALALLHTAIEKANNPTSQGNAMESIALVVESYKGINQNELAKQEFEIFINQYNELVKNSDLTPHCITNLINAMTFNDSYQYLNSDITNVQEGAKKGILRRLEYPNKLVQTDYTQIIGLLGIVEYCGEPNENIDKVLCKRSIIKIKKIIKAVKEDELNWIIDNFKSLATFRAVRFVVKDFYELLHKTTEENDIVPQYIYELLKQFIKYGLVTQIRQDLITVGTSRQYNYKIQFEDISFTIKNVNKIYFDELIQSTLSFNNVLATQYREFKPILNNSGECGLPVAAIDMKLCSLVNGKIILNCESWHLSLLHLSDQHKSEPSAVFVLMERRDLFGYCLMYKIYVVDKKLCAISHVQHHSKIITVYLKQIFGEMNYDFVKLTKPRFYVSLGDSISLEKGEQLIHQLSNVTNSKEITEFELMHETFKKYFNCVHDTWNDYKAGQNVKELEKEFLLKLNESDGNMVRRDSQFIDDCTNIQEKQMELQKNIKSLEN